MSYVKIIELFFCKKQMIHIHLWKVKIQKKSVVKLRFEK